MEALNYFINNHIELLITTIMIIAVISLLINIIQGFILGKVKSNYNKAFKEANIDNIEDLLINYNKEISNIKTNNVSIINDINRIQVEMNKSYAKTALLNYDAYDERAGKLSFIYVLLDRTNSGVLINGIYNRDGHYLYPKKITNGRYEKELSKEENRVLAEAMSAKE